MPQALELVHMTMDTAPAGLLVRVQETPDTSLNLDEQIAVRAAFLLEQKLDYVFFRRFNDGRSSQVSAYIVDNTNEKFNNAEIGDLHHNVWLSGVTPLLYVGQLDQVVIYSCARAAKTDRYNKWQSEPAQTVKLLGDIAEAQEKAKPYSAFRLADGTFWEDSRNVKLINLNKAAHKALIAEVKHADDKLQGSANPIARHLLLLTLLLKYLEDRKVFPDGWFISYHHEAFSCLHVLKHGGKDAVLRMLRCLEEKFNGDIFRLNEEDETHITENLLENLADLVCPDLDSRSGQLYLWDIYSFEYIPVEVLSHIYQHFADRDKGAIFTPPMVVNLMLDQVMPLDTLTGNETIFDPTCGSGIFLVSAFRRLINAWTAQRNWQRPSPADLKNLLSRTIFGVELQQQAAELASFSLALAICDALQPEVIWEQLRFDKLIGNNIFIGDYCEQLEAAKQKTQHSKGFDVVIGNPPFKSELTLAMEERAKAADENIPDNQAAYFILNDCALNTLAPSGAMCMLQNAGFLYNDQADGFRQRFFSRHQTDGILDFVSIRGLFKGADTKVVAVLVRNRQPSPEHYIHHWTFRRTFAADSKLVFDLDYYDYHKVEQSAAIRFDWIWLSNLLGGGRLFHLVKRLSTFQDLETYLKHKGWQAREGYIGGNRKQHAPWLKGKPIITAQNMPNKATSISPKPSFSIEKEEYFKDPTKKENYQPPLFIIREHISLPCGVWEASFLAYKNEFVGITVAPSQAEELKKFASVFIAARPRLTAYIQLTGHRSLSTRATAVYKKDIMNLPWPENGDWELAPWENELLDDVNNYMADYVRLGQESELLLRTVSQNDREKYCSTFLRLVKKVFPAMRECGHGMSDGLMYQAFSFRDDSPVDWLQGDWSQHLRSTIFKKQGDADSFRSIRLLRLYEGDTLIFVKPDRLRYWIRSVAIRDVDDTLGDILQGNEQNA